MYNASESILLYHYLAGAMPPARLRNDPQKLSEWVEAKLNGLNQTPDQKTLAGAVNMFEAAVNGGSSEATAAQVCAGRLAMVDTAAAGEAAAQEAATLRQERDAAKQQVVTLQDVLTKSEKARKAEQAELQAKLDKALDAASRARKANRKAPAVSVSTATMVEMDGAAGKVKVPAWPIFPGYEPDPEFKPGLVRIGLPIGEEKWPLLPGDFLRIAAATKRNLLLSGPQGTGKTYSQNLMRSLGWVTLYVPAGRTATQDTLLWSFDIDPKTKGIIIQPGTLTAALLEADRVNKEDAKAGIKGRIIYVYIDEYPQMPPPLACMLYGVLENPRRICMPQGRVVEVPDNVRFLATGNTAGRGDLTGGHVATEVHDTAGLSRWATQLVALFPKKEDEADYLVSLGLDPQEADELVEVTSRSRELWLKTIKGTAQPNEVVEDFVSLRASREYTLLRAGGVPRREAFLATMVVPMPEQAASQIHGAGEKSFVKWTQADPDPEENEDED